MSDILKFHQINLTPEEEAFAKARLDAMDAIFTIFDMACDVDGLTDEEVNEELREMGYDPEELGKKFAKIAKGALEKTKVRQNNGD